MNKYDKQAQQWVNQDQWENKRAEEAGKLISWVFSLGKPAVWVLALGGFCVAVYAFFDWIVG